MPKRVLSLAVAAAIVAIAGFAAADALLHVVRSDEQTGPASTSTRAPISTDALASTYPDPVGFAGLAPAGAEPSSPPSGELVVGFFFGHTPGDPGRFEVHVYSDGRLISQRLGGDSVQDSTGLVEQRLTPEGVERLRSEVLGSGLFDGEALHLTDAPGLFYGGISVRDGDRLLELTWGDVGPVDAQLSVPTDEQTQSLERLDTRFEFPGWLPPTAWDDREMRAFVPSMYVTCLNAKRQGEIAAALARLPRRAIALFQHADRPKRYARGSVRCYALTTDDARELARIVRHTPETDRVTRDVFGLGFVLHDPVTAGVGLELSPMLPDQL
jgi:hypothetical protein